MLCFSLSSKSTFLGYLESYQEKEEEARLKAEEEEARLKAEEEEARLKAEEEARLKAEEEARLKAEGGALSGGGGGGGGGCEGVQNRRIVENQRRFRRRF